MLYNYWWIYYAIADSFITYFYRFFFFSDDVNYEELARCTDDFNGAQCKAVCVEAVSIRYRYDMVSHYQYIIIKTSIQQ